MNRFAFQASAAAIPLRDYQGQSVDALVNEIQSAGRTTNKFVVKGSCNAANSRP